MLNHYVRIKWFFHLIFISLIMSGCLSINNNTQGQMYLEIPEQVIAMPSAKHNIQHNQGSLFNRGKNPIFGDRKAMRVNDLITVVISEAANSSTKASKKLNDSSNYALSGGILGAKDSKEPNGVANLLSGLNNLSNIKFDSSSQNTFAGSGTNTRNESFQTNITVKIVKAMNNGTYYIQGSRELLINGEHQYLTISGIIRSDDISANNIINSRYIADAKIHYATKGSIAVSSKLSWGTRLIRNIWPF